MGERRHTEIGAPEDRIAIHVGFVLTPRDIDLEPGSWTRTHRSPKAILLAATSRVKSGKESARFLAF
jgi:hypothetical protein